MPVSPVNAALTSSSAFFIDAAAKTITVLSCADAEGMPAIESNAIKAATKRVIGVMWRSMVAVMRGWSRKRAKFCESDRAGSAVPEGARRAYGASRVSQHTNRNTPAGQRPLRASACQCHRTNERVILILAGLEM